MTNPRILLIGLAVVAFTGCASLPENTERSEQDPWERYNRAMYQFNDAVDRAVLKPVAKGYRAITPDPVEQGVSNFFSNLSYPLVIVNQLLQGDFLDALSDTGRFLVNSTIGVGGIFDPATHFGLEANNEDFGQTLGRWGVPSGPFVVLPFLGPSTVRDTGALAADFQYDPMVQLFDEPERYYVWALGIVNMRAELLDLDAQLQSAYDPYAFIRDAYLQRREYLVHDGNPPLDEDYYDDLYEDFDSFEDMPDGDERTEEPAEAGSEDREVDETSGEQ